MLTSIQTPGALLMRAAGAASQSRRANPPQEASHQLDHVPQPCAAIGHCLTLANVRAGCGRVLVSGRFNSTRLDSTLNVVWAVRRQLSSPRKPPNMDSGRYHVPVGLPCETTGDAHPEPDCLRLRVV